MFITKKPIMMPRKHGGEVAVYRDVTLQMKEMIRLKRDVYGPCKCGSGKKFRFCCGKK